MKNNLVHAHIFKPHNALFKSVRNDKAECHTIRCTHSDQCGLFARGECSWRRSFGWSACPYGKPSTETGFTKRARKYHDWIHEREERHKGIGTLSSHTDMMAEIGDYVFLPYSHMTSNENVPFVAKGGAFLKGNAFLPKESFTIENIIKICEFRPQSLNLFGGGDPEIKSYQAEEVPKFLIHLSEQMIGVFDELCTVYPRAREIVDNISYKERKAVLATVVPNVGTFVDIHGGKWTWDGTYLVSTNSRASFMLVGRREIVELRIKPAENAVVKVTCNEQVDKNTKLLS